MAMMNSLPAPLRLRAAKRTASCSLLLGRTALWIMRFATAKCAPGAAGCSAVGRRTRDRAPRWWGRWKTRPGRKTDYVALFGAIAQILASAVTIAVVVTKL